MISRTVAQRSEVRIESSKGFYYRLFRITARLENKNNNECRYAMK